MELPPLATVLPAPEGRDKAQVQVELQACISEVGVLELRCIDTQDAGQSWLLPFAVRWLTLSQVRERAQNPQPPGRPRPSGERQG